MPNFKLPKIGNYKLYGKRQRDSYRRKFRRQIYGYGPEQSDYDDDEIYGVKKKPKKTFIPRKPRYGEPGFIMPTTYKGHENWETCTIPEPSDVTIIARESWGASHTEGLEPLDTPVVKVGLFYTGTEGCFTKGQCLFAMRKLQHNFITKKGLLDIPYNFLIGTDGKVYEGRGWDYKPTKVHKLYKYRQYKELQNSIDIAYVGQSFAPEDEDLHKVFYWPKSSFLVPMAHALLSLLHHGLNANLIRQDFSLVSEI